MTDHQCKLEIANASIGGKLTGGFVDRQGVALPFPPVLRSGDRIVVTINYPAVATPPAQLSGTFVFSAAPSATAQATATPFVREDGNFVCLTTGTSGPLSIGGVTTYTFTSPAHPGGGPQAAYELTFVAADNTNPAQPIQWSEDPEFDTSS